MARPTNKLERRLSNKNRLRRLYYSNGHNTRNSKVTFLIRDKEDLEDSQDCYYDNAKNLFLTWELPACDCSMVEYVRSNSCGKYYKRYSNRVVRRTKEIYKGNQYRKVFDYWWTID